MSTIVIVHPSGADRDALASYLQGHCSRLLACSANEAMRQQFADAGSLPAPLIFLLHEDSALELTAAPFLANHPIYVLGKNRSLNFDRLRQRIAIPWFPAEVLEMLRGDLPAPVSEVTVPTMQAHGTLLPAPDTGLLLRALAHALRNPLGGADGWLQLIAQTSAQNPAGNKPLKQARQNLQRLSQMLQAISQLGTEAPQTPARADLRELLMARRQEAEAEQLVCAWPHLDGPMLVRADAQQLNAALCLFFGSLLDERTVAQEVAVAVHQRPDAVILTVQTGAALLQPLSQRWNSLAELLHATRPARALAWALMVRTAEDHGGAVAVTHHSDRATLQLVLLRAEQEAAE